MISTAFGSAEN